MGQSPKMNYTEIEKCLKDMGEKERDSIRSFLTKPSTSYQERKYAIELLEELAYFVQGFLYCIEVSDSREKADFYRQYFDQARSKNGIESRIE